MVVLLADLWHVMHVTCGGRNSDFVLNFIWNGDGLTTAPISLKGLWCLLKTDFPSPPSFGFRWKLKQVSVDDETFAVKYSQCCLSTLCSPPAYNPEKIPLHIKNNIVCLLKSKRKSQAPRWENVLNTFDKFVASSQIFLFFWWINFHCYSFATSFSPRRCH